MTTLQRQLEASLSAADSELVAEMRRRADAAPLIDEHHPVLLEASKLRTLLRLAEEAVARRVTDGPPPQIGPRGRVWRAGLDENGDYSACVVFDSEDAIRAAGALLFRAVSIEPVFDAGAPANESTPGRGVALTQEPPP